MADANGNTTDPLIEALTSQPWAFDFFRAVRLIECRHPELPRTGFSISPAEDAIRFWQNPSLRFAPASLDSIRWTLPVEIERKLDEICARRAGDAGALDICVIVHPSAIERLHIGNGHGGTEIRKRFPGKLTFEADPRLRTEDFRIVNITTKENSPGGQELAAGKGGIVPRMAVNFFGLLGPNAPLPPHLTEYVLERELHHHDATITAFLNVFHHRLISLFYRAWAANQKALDLDRPKDQRYSIYLGALFGIGMDTLQDRDAVPDPAKLFFSGRLACQTRNAEGLEAILREYFHIPAEVQPFAGRWLALPADSICRLGESEESGTMGINSILGERFWDSQLSFRMRFGPMSLADYERMLPKGDAFARLKHWVLNYCGEHFFWDAQLVLQADEVPVTRLGETGVGALSSDDLTDLPAFAAKLTGDGRAGSLSHNLWSQLTPATQEILRGFATGGHVRGRDAGADGTGIRLGGVGETAAPRIPLEQRQAVVGDINRVIRKSLLLEADGIDFGALSTEMRATLVGKPTEAEFPQVNRRLLEELFPKEVAKHPPTGASLLSVEDLTDVCSLAAKLSTDFRLGSLPNNLWNQLAPSTQQVLRECAAEGRAAAEAGAISLGGTGGGSAGKVPWEHKQAIVDDINRVLRRGLLQQEGGVDSASFSNETRALLKGHPGQAEFPAVNRRLLEDVFPAEISGHRRPGGLGWTTWLKTKAFSRDADDLILNPPRE